jgi:glycosyltransferase involved in cell wall biosynthesis
MNQTIWDFETDPELVLQEIYKPLISVYTPTYNRNKLLRERALRSVLNQTYKDWEYIVVHDGKEDHDLGEILDSYDDRRIRYYSIERKADNHNYDTEAQWLLGGTYPSNFALDKVKGEWIARLDDDDIWTPDHLERSLEFAIKGNYDFITSQFIILKGDKEIMLDFTKHKIVEANIKIGCHSSWFYKESLNLFRYNPNCHKKKWNRVNDADFLERILGYNIKYGFLEEVLTYIKVRDNEKEIGLKAVRDKIES